MDWLSQVVEPYHCKIKDVLAAMPEEYVLSFDDVRKYLSATGRGRIHAGNIALNSTRAQGYRLSFTESEIIRKSYRFQINDMSTILICMKQRCISGGEIRLVKTNNCVSDQDIKEIMCEHYLDYRSVRSPICTLEAVEDLGHILFEDSSLLKDFKSKTKKGKYHMLACYINESPKTDIFKIRSDSAYKDFIDLIKEYLLTKKAETLALIYKVILRAKSGQVTYKIG